MCLRNAWVICQIRLSIVVDGWSEVSSVSCSLVSEVSAAWACFMAAMLDGVCSGIEIQRIDRGAVASKDVSRGWSR